MFQEVETEKVVRFLSRIRVGGPNECWIWTGALKWSGYGFFWVKKDGKKKMVLAHRFAYALCRGGFPSRPLMVLHSCHNRKCCNPKHLRSGLAKENTRDMLKAERQARGAKHGCAKLTEEQVREILSYSGDKSLSQNKIASMFGVSRQTISSIQRKIIWAHLH